MEFFDKYFAYCGQSEVPYIFHRWTALSIIGATLARKVYFPFGHAKIYPNQYILLTGSPGSRKGTAIKTGIELLKELQYDYFAPNKAAKEALWEWMAKQPAKAEVDDWIDDVIDGGNNEAFISQAYISNDEFLDFVGVGDEGLMTNLTNLWDNLTKYEHPKTRAQNITVYNPTINIVSGITPGGIAETFKSLASSGGFFSRILFIFSQPNQIKVAFPQPPNQELKQDLVFLLNKISQLEGKIRIKSGSSVYKFLEELYINTPPMLDSRFTYYSQRRFTHLLKLIIILSAADLTLEPTMEHCILANTILANAESQMHNAIGEYGKSKHAEVSNKVVELLETKGEPIPVRQIWKVVARDLDKLTTLQEILQNLLISERIKRVEVKGNICYIAKVQVNTKWKSKFIDYSLLHPYEHTQDTGDMNYELA